MVKQNLIVLTRRVESKILVLRNRKVILDTGLAERYGVAVKRLNEQVKRNAERFPSDFVFRLKTRDLRSQFATLKTAQEQKRKQAPDKRGGRRYQPFAFTEHGAIMAATVLNSKQAVAMSIFVVRAFVHMRDRLATNQKIIAKLSELARRVRDHDPSLDEIMAAIREMMTPPASPGRKIGFEPTKANF
jgi:phage regulator Rha-like protein